MLCDFPGRLKFKHCTIANLLEYDTFNMLVYEIFRESTIVHHGSWNDSARITPGPGIVFIAGIRCHTIIVSSRVQAHFTNSR